MTNEDPGSEKRSNVSNSLKKEDQTSGSGVTEGLRIGVGPQNWGSWCEDPQTTNYQVDFKANDGKVGYG